MYVDLVHHQSLDASRTKSIACGFTRSTRLHRRRDPAAMTVSSSTRHLVSFRSTRAARSRRITSNGAIATMASSVSCAGKDSCSVSGSGYSPPRPRANESVAVRSRRRAPTTVWHRHTRRPVHRPGDRAVAGHHRGAAECGRHREGADTETAACSPEMKRCRASAVFRG